MTDERPIVSSKDLIRLWKRTKLSQYAVWKRSGLSLATVQSVLNGERETSLLHAVKIARALGYDLIPSARPEPPAPPTG